MKKLSAFYIISVLSLTLGSFPSYAKNYSVCTVEIPGGMTKDKEGPQPLFNFYQEVIKDVSAKTGHTFELQFAPSRRCQNLFFKKEIDILWPFIIAEKKERITDQGYSFLPIYSMPIIMGGYHIVTRSDQPIINKVKDLDGKSVVSARGYGVPFEYEKSETITKSITNDNALIPKMVTGKRVDAGIIQTGWIPTLREQGLLEGLHHGEVIDFWGGSFVFHPDQEGVGLMNSFSNTILHLVTQGKYRDMMTGAPYYIPNY